MLALPVQGAYIAYQSEIHTGNNVLTFYNHASSTLDITRIRVYIGDQANFDLGADFDALLAITTTSPSSTITIAHFPFVADDTSTTVGLVGTIDSYFTDGAKVVDLNFTDFNPGEAWGVRVDIDSLTAGVARGTNLGNILVSVYYTGGYVLTSACNDPYMIATAGAGECLAFSGLGNGRSFPSYNFATVGGVPEPSGGLLVASAVPVLLYARLRRRRQAHTAAAAGTTSAEAGSGTAAGGGGA